MQNKHLFSHFKCLHGEILFCGTWLSLVLLLTPKGQFFSIQCAEAATRIFIKKKRFIVFIDPTKDLQNVLLSVVLCLC